MIFLFILLLLVSPTLAASDAPSNMAESTVTWDLNDFPQTIYDDNYEDWRSELIVGNYGTKVVDWYDGPGKEAGGSMTPASCAEKDGIAYCAWALAAHDEKHIIAIDPSTGIARTYMYNTGKDTGDRDEVIGGDPFYDDVNDIMYITGRNCIRKIVDDGDGTESVELVAGQCRTPCTSSCDGTGSAATFGDIKGWTVVDGTIYVMEFNGIYVNGTLRKINPTTKVVTTHAMSRSEDPSNITGIVEFSYNVLSSSDDTSIIYLSDTYNTSFRKTISTIDLSSYSLTRIVGVADNDSYSRDGAENDGPATTHYGANGGIRGIFSKFYDKYIIDNNDSLRLHWLTTEDNDDWVKTIALSTRPGVTRDTWDANVSQAGEVEAEWAVPGYFMGPVTTIVNTLGVDSTGGIWIRFKAEANGIYRIYNPTLGGSAWE